MMVVLIFLLVIVAGLVVALVVGKVGTDAMADPNRTSPFELPEGPLRAADVEKVTFDQSVRGYNMAQVDAVLDKLRREMVRLEEDHAPESTHEPESAADTAEGASALGSIVQFRARHRRDDASDVTE